MTQGKRLGKAVVSQRISLWRRLTSATACRRVPPTADASTAPHSPTSRGPSVDSQLRFSDHPCIVSTLGSIAVVAGVALAVCSIVIRFRRARWIGFADKTLWDWLQLMVIPLVLAGVAFALNAFQNDRDQSREDHRAAEQAKKTIEDQREATLRTYISDMSDLLLEHGLANNRPPSRTRTVAHLLTLTALRRLDGQRKGLVVQFLSDSHLIANASPVVDLGGADLRGVGLDDAYLIYGAEFANADLRDAHFRNSYVRRPNFYNADLRGADFTNARLPNGLTSGEPGACLSRTRFAGAEITGRDFAGAGYDIDFSGAILDHVDFQGEFSHLSFQGALLNRVVFEGASEFSDLSFRGARLTDTKVPARSRAPTTPQVRERIDEVCATTRFEAIALFP
jgi:uncharacterized protein YjbI with pentapeptide repeats